MDFCFDNSNSVVVVFWIRLLLSRCKCLRRYLVSVACVAVEEWASLDSMPTSPFLSNVDAGTAMSMNSHNQHHHQQHHQQQQRRQSPRMPTGVMHASAELPLHLQQLLPPFPQSPTRQTQTPAAARSH
jgi:hypothetical protein